MLLKFVNWEEKAALLTAQLILVFVGFGSSYYWINYVGVETYTSYQSLVAALSFLAIFCFSGFTNSLSLSAAKNYHGDLKKITVARFWYGVSMTPILFAIVHLWYEFSAAVAIFTALLFPFYTIHTHWVSWLNGGKKFKQYLINTLVFSVSSVSCLVLLNNTEKANLALTQLTVTIAVGILLLVSISYTLKNKKKSIRNYERGKQLSGAFFIDSLAQLDKVILAGILAANDVAFYFLVFTILSPTRMLFSTFVKYYVPRFAESDDLLDVNNNLKTAMPALYLTFVAMGLIGYVLLVHVVQVIYPGMHGLPMTAALCWLVVCLGMPLSLYSVALHYVGSVSACYRYNYSTAIVKLVVLVSLVSWLGVATLPYALLVSVAFNNAFALINFRSELKRSH